MTKKPTRAAITKSIELSVARSVDQMRSLLRMRDRIAQHEAARLERVTATAQRWKREQERRDASNAAKRLECPPALMQKIVDCQRSGTKLPPAKVLAKDHHTTAWVVRQAKAAARRRVKT